MNYDNNYFPTHAEHFSLPWYDRDGLMSYIDSLKDSLKESLTKLKLLILQ